ncbi:hypothetical protein QFC19_001864 [Naganishia cerealis]|uniref:Uncharacterized protein n=1 Tax=Naganishia cerealis TaxID=610337 RepID=A0ACC2WDQ3_9TREE|nr:hypothetical protein QFC19_001864 [Naganishia cerealis]
MSDIQIPLPLVQTSLSALPMYQSPHLIATYSHLPDRSIQHSDASISYHKGASIGDDLKAGYGSYIERDPLLNEHLDGLCQSLLKYRKEGGSLKSGALITWRGMLTSYYTTSPYACRLLTAAFSDRDTWEMNAVAFNGNVYLEDHVTKEERLKRIEEEKAYKQQSYFGYSFEAFSTTDVKPKAGKTALEKAKKRKRPSEIAVNTNVQWCCVVKSKIGVKIEVGFRDAQGTLINLETFMTSQIPRTIHKTPNAPWDAAICLQTFEALVAQVLGQVITTDPIPTWKSEGADLSSIPEATVWRIKFQPKQGLLMKKLGAYTPENEDPKQRWGFLPLSFVEKMLE